MKLTKEDFDLHKCTATESYMLFIANYNPYEVIDKILENQEKASKWNRLFPTEIDPNEFSLATMIEWKEKAEKWDESSNMNRFIFDLQKENKQLKEIVERVKQFKKKYEELIQSTDDYFPKTVDVHSAWTGTHEVLEKILETKGAESHD